MNEIHDKLVDASLELDVGSNVLEMCDRLAKSVNEVVVQGTIEREGQVALESESRFETGIRLGGQGLVDVGLSGGDRSSSRYAQRERTTGTAQHRVHLGAASTWLERLVEGLPVNRVWVLLDEWSAVNPEHQPLLADMLRRCLLTVPKVTVKIGAIAHRSHFIEHIPEGYLGFELGADIFASLDLDEFVVFPSRSKAEREERATTFFRELLFKHVQAILNEAGGSVSANSQEFVTSAFTQVNALREVVRAAEGVPRDALSIVARAAQRVPEGGHVSTDDVRDAAEGLYSASQEQRALNAHPYARDLLTRILTRSEQACPGISPGAI